MPLARFTSKIGTGNSVDRRFSKWSKKDASEAIFNNLVQAYGAFFEDVPLDSS